MDVLGIDQMDFDSPSLQDLEQGYPVDPRRFHCHRIDATLFEPVCQLVQIFGEGRKRSHRIAVPICRNGNKDFSRSDVDTTSVRSHLRQTPVQFSMLPYSWFDLWLRHGSSPFMKIRQRARRAKLKISL